MNFNDVIDAFEEAGINSRDAYWASGRRPSDGDRQVILRIDGKDYTPVSVAVEDERIIVTCEPS